MNSDEYGGAIISRTWEAKTKHVTQEMFPCGHGGVVFNSLRLKGNRELVLKNHY